MAFFNFFLFLEMAFSPYNSPIDPGFYSTLALVLMVAGLASSAVFIVKQVWPGQIDLHGPRW